jgi:hypothetical protein
MLFLARLPLARINSHEQNTQKPEAFLACPWRARLFSGGGDI